MYKLNDDKFIEKRKEFNNTLYGERVFLNAYICPIIGLLFLLILVLETIITYAFFKEMFSTFMFIMGGFAFLITALYTITSYAIGSAYYLKELNKYVNETKPKKHFFMKDVK